MLLSFCGLRQPFAGRSLNPIPSGLAGPKSALTLALALCCSQAGAESLAEVRVSADKLGARTYDRADLDASPKGNRDLTAVIADHPAVTLNPTMAGSGNRGSLAPESFSIHGESPYQNQFLIDGLAATNAINPQEQQPGLQVGRVPGFSQAYNLDTDLLDQVRVYDNRIPVEYGRFQGGVVDARIKTPEGLNRLSVRRSFNSSNLTRQQMPESAVEDWKNGEPGYAAEWKKHFSSLQADLRLTADSSALLAFSRRQSLIQRQAKVLDRTLAQPHGKAYALEMRDEKDQVDDLLAKIHTDWGGGTRSALVLKYADRQEDLVSNSYVDTGWTNRQTALGLGMEVWQQLDSGRLTLKLGVDQLNAQRESSADSLVVQMFADKSLSSYTWGGFGAESLEQRQYTGGLRMDWKHGRTGPVGHKVYAGLDLINTQARFVRQRDAYTINQTQQTDGSQTIATQNLYRAGSVSAGLNDLSLYLADTMEFGNLALLASGRLQRDSLLHNTHLAPRLGLDWDVLGDGRTQLGMGWSRYYGLDLMGYALAQGKSELLSYVIQKGVTVNRPAALVRHGYDGLKTAYSDEWAFDWVQQLSPRFEASLSYVHRASRDGVTAQGNASDGYAYTNAGQGRAETATLSLRTSKPWQAAGAAWTGRLAFSWKDAYRNHDSSLGWEAEGLAADDLVEVNGVQMQRQDKPYSAFTQPRELSLSANAHWAGARVSWGNRLQWKSSRAGIAYLGTSRGVERYASQRLPSNWTWDSQLTYQPRQLPGLTLNLEVLNLLNRQAPLAIASASAANNVRYQTGREIWLTAGYEF